MKHLLLSALVCYVFLFSSCKKFQPAPPAFFIKTGQVSVSTTSAQGTGSHKITDLYLYVNGMFQGAYPVGNTMPIITHDQNTTINVLAGIKNNGISGTSTPWVFYDKLELDTLVQSGKTINRNFTFKYNANTKFVWLENFDNSVGFSLVKAQTPFFSDTMFKITSPANSFEGRSIEIGLTSPNSLAHFESSVFYDLPIGNTNVYLEMNYKGSQEFEVGVYDGIDLKSSLMVNPKDEWNKIYIQLSDAVSRGTPTGKYKVYFRMRANSTGDARVWLDNIKLIYL